jgi:putative hydrolase of the HAD superfamily
MPHILEACTGSMSRSHLEEINMRPWILFDWGDTLMRTLEYPGPMCAWPEVEVIPGTAEALRELSGRAGIALATNAADSQEDEIWKALARAGLDPFIDRIFCFKSVGHKKSSPPFFAHVMEQLGLPAARLVMVGDDFEQDVTAANAVGIQAVWFNEKSHESREEAGHFTIHHLRDLPGQLDARGFLNDASHHGSR